MAPAASIHSSATTAAGASKRPAADSDAELPLDSSALHQQGDEAARKGQGQQQLECPRCRSTNTKFCYYNNYSTAQPRHFCRACRRYWTHGGTLRDVPVGGASRRASSSSSGGGKRRRVSVSAEPSSTAASASASASPPPSLADACLPVPDLPSACFPFLSNGSFFPQFDFGGVAPAAFPSWQSVLPDFYDGFAPWDDGATTAGADAAAAMGFAGAWGDIAGLDLSWTPPGN